MINKDGDFVVALLGGSAIELGYELFRGEI